MARTIAKWMVFSILSVSGLILFLAVLLEILISIPPGERFLRGLVQNQASRALERNVSIGSIETDFLSWILIRNVNIYQVREGDVIPFLNVEQVSLRYDILPLLKRNLLIRSIGIRNMKVNIIADSTGKTNIPLTDRKPSEKPSPIHVDIRKIAISHSSLRYCDRTIPLDASLNTIDGDVSRLGNGYTFRVAADSSLVVYKQEGLNTFNLRTNGSWSDGLLRLDRIAMSFHGLTAEGNRLAWRSGPDSLLAGTIRMTGNPDGIFDFLRNTVSPGLPLVSGDIDLEAELGGSLRSLRIDAVLSSPILRVRDIRLQKSFIRFSWTNDTTTLDSLSLGALGGNLHGHGKMNTRTFLGENIALIFDGLDVKRVAQLIAGSSEYGGRASGALSGYGYFTGPDSLRARARLTVQSPVYKTHKIPDISFEASLIDGNARAGLVTGDAHASADARIESNRLNGTYHVTIPRISDFTGLAGISDLDGSIDGQGTVAGPFSSLEVRATLNGQSIKYKNFPVDAMNGDVVWRKNNLSFSGFRVSGNLAAIADLLPPLHVDSLSGAARYTGIIDGDIVSPRAEVFLELDKPVYRDFRFDTGTVRALVRGDTLDLTQAILETDSLRIQAYGALDYKKLNGSAALEFGEKALDPSPAPGARVSAVFDMKNGDALSVFVRGEDISLPVLGRFAPASPPVNGMLNFTGTIGGSPKDPEARIAFDVRNPGFGTVFMDSLRGEVSFRNGQVFLQSADMYRDAFHTTLDASLTLEKTGTSYTFTGNSPLQGTMKGDNLKLGIAQSLLPPSAGKMSGTAAYDLAFDGTLSNPHPRGTANVTGFSLSQPVNGSFITGADILASVRDDTLTVSARNGQLLQKPFSVEARVNYTPPAFSGNMDFFYDGQKAVNVNGTYARDRMDMTARTEDFNLSILKAFVPALDTMSGILNTDLTITGTVLDPQLNGALKIRNLNMDFPEWDAPLRNGVVSLNISPNRVEADTLFLKSRKGSIRASGYLSDFFSKSAKSELQVTIDKVQVKQKNFVDVTVNSAQLAITGTGNKYLVTGNANLGETKILYNLSIQSLLEQLTTPLAPLPPPPDFMKQVGLNIVVNGGDRIDIKNSLADIRTRVDVEVIGTLAAPNFLGSATVVEGTVQYLDRKFTIKEGDVQFTNRTELNPTLNIQAETTVTTYSMFGSEPYTVTLAVSGSSKNPTVKLTSDPTLREPDIITLLTLGVTPDQVGFGSAASDTTASLQNVLKQRAELLTSQRVAGYLGHEIGGLLGLQNLTVEGNLFDINGEEGGPRIIATKQISSDVEVTYISTLGRQSDQGIQVNYNVTGNFTLRGQTDSLGRSGLDILYRLRFR